MKDLTRQLLESHRPSTDALTTINYCLDALFEEKEKRVQDFAVKNLTYEELIGALLLARDHISVP